MAETNIAEKESSLISPADPTTVIEVMRRFEEFKSKVLNKDDFVILNVRGEKKPYIKKSGWMKYALACQISLEKREEHMEVLEGGTRIYNHTYRAIGPNGRFVDAVGSAATNERQFTHPDHDARSLSQTRASNRAISNLVAGGEVSAEELLNDAKARSDSKETNVLIETPNFPPKFDESVVESLMWQDTDKEDTETASVLDPLSERIPPEVEALIGFIKANGGKAVLSGWGYFYRQSSKTILRRREKT